MNRMLLQLFTTTSAIRTTQDLYQFFDTLQHESWTDLRQIHNWRNHIPDMIQALWGVLGDDARLVAYVMAEKVANNEEWD